MERKRHDIAHGLAVKLLNIFAPCLHREEEMAEAYREMMPAIIEALIDYDTRREWEERRLPGQSLPK